MKTNWKHWLITSIIVIGVLVILDARVNATASGKSLSVEVSDPVIPTILPPISEWTEYTGEVVLNTEINPRQNATGIIYNGPGGLVGGIDSLLTLQANAPAATEDDFLTPIVNIDGQGYTGVNPPDTVGDVGPNHYIQMINGGGGAIFRVYDKAGNPLTGSIDLDSFGTGACAGGIGDPVILYDQMADRWMLTEFSGSANVLCVYISQGPDPINDGWYAYNFTTPNFPDYPKYGVWPDGYYVTSNENSPAAYALDRVNMLNGAAATSIRFTAPPLSGFGFQALTPSDLDGEDLPPAGAPNYFMRHRDTEAHGNGNCSVAPDEDCLEIWAFHADFATPANSTFTEIADINVEDFDSELCGFSSFNCFQQPGTGTTLDPLREVIMFRLVYRNFGSYETLVGNFVTDVDDTDHGGVRWFELRKQGAGWNLYQEGTYAPDIHSRWMGAIAMDGSGNIAVGYNVSSTTLFPSLRYAGRLVSDPLGTLPQSEGVLVNGTASNNSNRYGDYSAMSVDPTDDCTFWFTGEYNNGGNWSTRIGAFKFEECGSPFSVETTPATAEACLVTTDEVAYAVAVGQNVVFTDPVTLATGTLPTNVSATFSDNPVVPADPPATSTLTLSGLTSSAAGVYSIAVTGSIPTRTVTSTVQLSLYDALASTTTLLTPTDGETGVTPAPTFTWDAVSGAQGYDLEIATDAAFTNIIYTASPTDTVHGMPIALDELHTYYWHVRPTNLCGEGTYSSSFSFTTREVPSILVVDDDDNSPNVRTYYTTALDDLGWAYDVWDTNTAGGEPTAPDLAPYQTVIWFTGDQTAGTAGPDETSETALSTWLDNTQGCFLLSSQDYFNDQGLTPFMTDYLGTGTLMEGEGNYGQIIGQGVFSALGTRSLLYPFTDSADWITPDATAELGLVGTNDRGAALTKEDGYKTSFWVFPFEAVYGAQNRRNAMDAFITWCGLEQPFYGVTLSADQAEGSPAGTTVTYEISITNTGNGADLFNLSLAGNVWTSELSAPSVSLNAGETATFTVVVTIPADAVEGATDSVTVMATSVSDGTITATTTLTTTVAPTTLNTFLPIVIR